MSHDNQARTRFMRPGQALWQPVLLLLTLALLVACGASTPPASEAAVQITLLPGPAGDGLQVQLHNAAHAPLTDATVALEGNMTHAGMAPVLTEPVKDGDDGASDGVYRVPFHFSMLGDWIVTVTVDLADGTQSTQDINVTVTDAGIQIQGGGNTGADQTNPSTTGAMMVHNAMVRAVPMAGGNGAIYFTVMNGTAQADRLVAVESDVAAATGMHESINENNVIRMEPRPAGFEIPAGGSVELAPGGKHVMLTNVKEPLVEGASITVTLRFDHAAPISVTVPILGLGSTLEGEHQHSGN